MSSDIEAYLKASQPMEDHDYMALQRAALAELIQLSAAVADPVEQAITSAHPQALAELTSRFETDKNETEAVFQSHSQQEKTRYREQVDLIEADFKKRMAAVNADAQRKRDHTIRAINDKEQALNKEHQDKLLVAEFVKDGSALKAKQQLKTAETAHQTDRQQLDNLSLRAEHLLRDYRQRIPDVTITPYDIAPDSNAREIFQTQRNAAQACVQKLEGLHSARVFMGWYPVIWTLVLIVLNLGIVTLLYQRSLFGLTSAISMR